MLRDLLLFYHELDYYFIEKENQDLKVEKREWNYQATETWGKTRQHREKLQVSQKY